MRYPRHVENLIAALRGLPEDRSKSKLRETVGIGDALDKVLEKQKLGKPRIEDTIQQNLDNILGSANAHYCALLRVEDGRRVFMAVTNPIIRQELFFNRKLILQRLRELPGGNGIRELILRAG